MGDFFTYPSDRVQLARKLIPNNPNANVENLKDLLEIEFDQIFKLIN